MQEIGGSGDNSWNILWKLKAPPKIKVFWWQVLNEFNPAKGILNHHHIEPVGFCEWCGSERETIKHIFMDCTTARGFWRKAKALTGVKLPLLHPLTWASDILRDEVCSEHDRCVIIIGMYALWTQRNRKDHGEQQLPLQKAVQWAVDMAHDFWQTTKQAMQRMTRFSVAPGFKNKTRYTLYVSLGS